MSGLTLDDAAKAIQAHLLRQETLKQFGTRLESLTVIVDVIAYNSKRYYVIFDGGGFGEQVFPFPITGSETEHSSCWCVAMSSPACLSALGGGGGGALPLLTGGTDIGTPDRAKRHGTGARAAATVGTVRS